jgi:hypothetical protein
MEMIARTSKTWINPPRVNEVTKPSNQRMIRTTAMVYSMAIPFY